MEQLFLGINMAAPDRLSFLDAGIALRTIFPSSLQNDLFLRSPGNIFNNVHFVPERVVQFSISQVSFDIVSRFSCTKVSKFGLIAS